MDKAISLSSLKHNLEQVQTLLPESTQLLAVVKANAYGHEAHVVAPFLERCGVRMFGVASVKEAVALRTNGVSSDILILSTITQEHCTLLFEHQLIATVSSPDMARWLVHQAEELRSSLRVHIKVDTGMSRCGAMPDEVLGIVQVLKESGYLIVEGLYSHFATADDEDTFFADAQEECFRQVVDQLQSAGIAFKHLHMGNSAALLTRSQKDYSLVRVGCLLYGAMPDVRMNAALDLQPVMHLSAQVVQLKALPCGKGVGYGGLYRTSEETAVAVLNTGYAHGIDRRMFPGGNVLINGQKRPIIGTVSMDLTIVKLEPEDKVHLGDPAVVLGPQGSQVITVQDIARTVGTVPYEILCRAGDAVSLVSSSDERPLEKRR